MDSQTADEKTIDEKTADEKTADEKTTDEKTADEKTIDEKTTDEKPAGKKTTGGKKKKRILKAAAIVAGSVLLVVILYFLYFFLSYYRIPDHQALEPEGNVKTEQMQVGKEYTIVTQNCGFGAYLPDFSFFMDGGTESRGKSRETVTASIDAAAEKIASFDPDFVLLQEVDTDSDRSYHVDQKEQLAGHFSDYQRVFAMNFHSPYLMYPVLKPHGASESGILTLSRTGITSALRRSLTVSSGLGKYVDLDRCYSVCRIPVANGKEMVLYNVHSSAYGGGEEVRTAQITQLTQDMLAEYEKGNYCICGGDFNHDFTGDSATRLGSKDTEKLGWAQPFPENLLPEGISRCIAYDDEDLIPTCRNCDVPYGPECMTIIVDGFLVSDNVTVTELHNIDTQFAYSDHNPVVLRFVLQE